MEPFSLKLMKAALRWVCPCEGVSGERPCNSCSFSDHIFTTGILNVVQQCRASEIIICENGAQVDSRIDLENKKCRKWTKEEEEFLRENLGKLTITEIAKKLDRPKSVVHYRVNKVKTFIFP